MKKAAGPMRSHAGRRLPNTKDVSELGDLIDMTNRLREGDARLLASYLSAAGFTAAPTDEYVWRLAASNAGVGVPSPDTKALTALFMAGAEVAGAR